jgi:hypothetical protein
MVNSMNYFLDLINFYLSGNSEKTDRVIVDVFDHKAMAASIKHVLAKYNSGQRSHESD